MDIKQRLLSDAEPEYKNFSASLIPNISNVIGVRLPVLRKIAAEIYKKDDWQNFLKQKNTEFMEEIMLQGMVIGLIKDEPEKILEHVKHFIPKIDNWSVCDSFCNGLKFTNKNQKTVWKFIQPYLVSKKEFEVRFGYVMLLTYFVTVEYIDEILEITNKFNHSGYYAQMSVAWLVSVCYVKFPPKTLNFLKNTKLDNWTFNKSIQKITESLKVPQKEKEKLKKLKR